MLDEKPSWSSRVEGVIDQVERASWQFFSHPFVELAAEHQFEVIESLLDDDDYRWFAQLVSGGYYADPDNGGNDGAASWAMLDWRRDPAGGWPPTPERQSPSQIVVEPSRLAGRYDAIVIGSGAGGGVAACGLAEAGRSVLIVETGGWPTTEWLAVDHLHNPRSTWDLESRSGPISVGNPRVLDDGATSILLDPSDVRWSNNAMTVGGGTRIYGAQAWRFGPHDFAMASRYGVPDGSALADWPFGFDELEPFYARAEWEIGVSGDSTDGAHAGERSRSHPMPPTSGGRARELLTLGAADLGISTLAPPLLINSVPYLGRPACARCAMCVGFACPVDAKNGSANTMLERAFATGRCSILLETRAERVVVDAAGRVVGVAVASLSDGTPWRSTISAEEIVVAAGAIESARLLLNSAHDREPNGIGNNTDQVGRHLQAHTAIGALGIFDETVDDLLGPGPAIATGDFRHGNAGIVGGGVIVNDFSPTPSNAYRYLVDAGVLPPHGLDSKRGMRDLSRRMLRLYAPIQEVTSAESRVRVDASTIDGLGIPVARLSGGLHPEDIRSREFLAERSEEWLRAAGASSVAKLPRRIQPGPSGGQHQAGTCRMGNDPARSVTDPWGRVWGHPNLRIADGSLHVTNGGVNPVLTIFANAMRIVEHMTSKSN